MGVISTCPRCTGALLNAAMMLAGLALIGLTLWVRLDDKFEYEIRRDLLITSDSPPFLAEQKENIKVWITVSFWVLIGFGVAAFLIGLYGIVSVGFGLRCPICFFLLLLLTMILLEIAVAIVVIVYRPQIREAVMNYVASAYQAHTLDYDSLRMRYDCCGIDGMFDQTCTGQPTCTSAVWDRLDFTLMIAGIILIIIIVLQIISFIVGILSCVVGGRRGRRSSPPAVQTS